MREWVLVPCAGCGTGPRKVQPAVSSWRGLVTSCIQGIFEGYEQAMEEEMAQCGRREEEVKQLHLCSLSWVIGALGGCLAPPAPHSFQLRAFQPSSMSWRRSFKKRKFFPAGPLPAPHSFRLRPLPAVRPALAPRHGVSRRYGLLLLAAVAMAVLAVVGIALWGIFYTNVRHHQVGQVHYRLRWTGHRSLC